MMNFPSHALAQMQQMRQMQMVLDVPAPARRLPRIASTFARDVIAGLSKPQKAIPSTWLYDHRGSELFEEITQLPEYYPTRTEIAILQHCAGEMAEVVGPNATVVEFGSGSSRKTPILLGALDSPAAYVPIDISADYLTESVAQLQVLFPKLPMYPIVGDFNDRSALAPLRRMAARPATGRRVGFFPGSTLGNFCPTSAMALLERMGEALGPEALLVVGIDSTLDPSVLVPAYDDAQGVTAEFNKNLLVRINRELDGDLDPLAFRHEARFNPLERRMEMHLVSRTWQTCEVLGRRFGFASGDSIHTENSYKYSRTRFGSLALQAGWAPLQFWTDANARLAVHVLERMTGD